MATASYVPAFFYCEIIRVSHEVLTSSVLNEDRIIKEAKRTFRMRMRAEGKLLIGEISAVLADDPRDPISQMFYRQFRLEGRFIDYQESTD